jgi:hypothetical protein
LNQGGTLEGVFNGFAHSADFRQLETATPGTTPAALRAFAEELNAIESELPVRTAFTRESARPLAPVVAPDRIRPRAARARPAPAASASPERWVTDYVTTFAGASRFTLKRVLADEALKLIDFKRSIAPETLAEWYGNWVARICGRGVDFGLELRNKADAPFHRAWARTAAPDRLTWEVLNRLLRVINHESAAPASRPPTAAKKEGG